MTRYNKKYYINSNKTYKIHLKRKIIAFFIILIIIMTSYFTFVVNPVLKNNIKVQVSSCANSSINKTMFNLISKNIKYDDIVDINRTNDNEIISINAKIDNINILARKIMLDILNEFKQEMNNNIKIPLGDFSGIVFISGVGPKINYKINPYGEVLCEFESKFYGSGINQTHHKLYLNLKFNINIVLPFNVLKMTSNTPLLLCDNIIVGKIPNVYLNNGIDISKLNLDSQKFSS